MAAILDSDIWGRGYWVVLVNCVKIDVSSDTLENEDIEKEVVKVKIDREKHKYLY